MSESAGRQDDDHEVLYALRMSLEHDDRHQALALRTWLPRIEDWYKQSRLASLASHAEREEHQGPAHDLPCWPVEQLERDRAKASPAGPDALAEEIDRLVALMQKCDHSQSHDDWQQLAFKLIDWFRFNHQRLRSRPAQDRDAERLTEFLHSRSMHPDYEYATTEGERKNFDEHPPAGEGWERNVHLGDKGWERFTYHEEAYWMRRKADAAMSQQEGKEQS